MKNTIPFLLIFIAGCTKVVDFDIPLNKPKVVINSLFNPDSVWQVQVSRSNSILDNPDFYFQTVGDAKISILDETNQIVESLLGYPNKYLGYSYRGLTKPLVGQTYKILVEVNNEPLLSAVNKIPSLVPIESVEVDSSKYHDFGDIVDMKITFNDPSKEQNYYLVRVLYVASYKVYEKDQTFTQELNYSIDDSQFPAESSIKAGIFSDNLFNGKKYTAHLKVAPGFSFSVNTGPVINSFRVYLYNISEEYYNYTSTKYLQESTNDDPFAQPVQVFTNIENGLGIFAGYHVSVFEVK